MPLVPSPSTGYTDYQTFGNYDSILLWGIDSFLGTSPVSSPVMNMTKYAALSGFVLCVSNQCLCTINWYGDVGLTELIAARSFTLTQNITSGFGAFIIPNMGAYAQIVCTNMGGVAFAINTLIFGTNRTSPVWWTPQNAVLIDLQNVAYGAGASTVTYPNDYYAGPMMVFCGPQTSPTGVVVELQAMNTSGTWEFLQDVSVLSANLMQVFVTPPGAWRLAVQNGTTAQNIYTTATASITGAT